MAPGRKIARLLGKARGESGQALVEFAIMAPVMVTIFLFAIFFYELIQIKLKAQEAARYAVWEMTAHRLHDYRVGPTAHASLADEALRAVDADIQGRFDDLDSATAGRGRVSRGAREVRGSNRFLATQWLLLPTTLANEPSPETGWENPIGFFVDIIRTVLTTVAGALSVIRQGVDPLTVGRVRILVEEARDMRSGMADNWGFNTNGYITTTVRVATTNILLPESFLDEEGRGGWFSNRLMPRSVILFTEEAGLLVDTWRLYDGTTSSPTVSGNHIAVDERNGFQRQVNRMYQTNLEWSSGAVTLGDFLRNATRLATLGQNVPSIRNAAVASQEYRARRDGDVKRSLSRGRTRLNVDGGRAQFDTLPYGARRDQNTPSGNMTVLYQRGEYFMGCPEPEQYGCGDSTSQTSPWGDGILPPPGYRPPAEGRGTPTRERR